MWNYKFRLNTFVGFMFETNPVMQNIPKEERTNNFQGRVIGEMLESSNTVLRLSR
jgi:hypothetical protein